MLKQKSYLLFTIIFVIAFILLFFVLLANTSSANVAPNTTESTLSDLPNKKSDVMIGLSEQTSETPEFSIGTVINNSNYHSFPAEAPVFFYRQGITPLIERRISLSRDNECHYGLFQTESVRIALFYVEELSAEETENLSHIIRCYVDYFPLAIIGNLTEESTALLKQVADLESIFADNYTILSANLTLTPVQDSLLNGTTTAPPKSLDLQKPMVAVTFDDGPSPFTLKVLAAIEKYNAKATFYTLGVQAETYPQTVLAIFKSGCEIGNHTNLHEIFSSNTPGIIQKTVNETNQKLRNILGIGAATLRPPTGAVRDRNGNAITVGFPIILWSIDTRDFESNPDETTLLSTIMQNITDGGIILMHDTHEITANAADEVFNAIISAGFQTVTVSELLEFKFDGASINTVYKGNSLS